jgi:hypothetical protein
MSGFENKSLTFFMLFCWYFATHAITHPSFFIEDEIYDRTVVSLLQSDIGLFSCLLIKIVIQILIDLVKSIPLFIILFALFREQLTLSPAFLASGLILSLLVVSGLYGLGMALSSFIFISNKISHFASLLAYFSLFYSVLIVENKNLWFLNILLPFDNLRNLLSAFTVKSFALLSVQFLIYWLVAYVLFNFMQKKALKRGNLFDV